MCKIIARVHSIDSCAKNMTQVNWKFLLVKSSERSFYLHLIWLCGSWFHQRILKKLPSWKYNSWFSSEVSKLTSVWNKLNLSLKYWFMEARLDFCKCYGPTKWSKCHLDTIQTIFSEDNKYYRGNIGENIYLSSLKMRDFSGSLPKCVLTPQKKPAVIISKWLFLKNSLEMSWVI